LHALTTTAPALAVPRKESERSIAQVLERNLVEGGGYACLHKTSRFSVYRGFSDRNMVQVLGRNLEAMVTRAQTIKEQWKDKFVSVEHLVLAYLDDARFGQRILKEEGLDYDRLANAIKEVRGSNAVTDQVSAPPPPLPSHKA